METVDRVCESLRQNDARGRPIQDGVPPYGDHATGRLSGLPPRVEHVEAVAARPLDSIPLPVPRRPLDQDIPTASPPGPLAPIDRRPVRRDPPVTLGPDDSDPAIPPLRPRHTPLGGSPLGHVVPPRPRG